jgi:hypothetical protein
LAQLLKAANANVCQRREGSTVNHWVRVGQRHEPAHQQLIQSFSDVARYEVAMVSPTIIEPGHLTVENAAKGNPVIEVIPG